MNSIHQSTLVIDKTPEAVALSVAQLITETAMKAIAKRGVFTLGLSGGSTPLCLFTLLSTPEWEKRIPWEKTIVTWVDERCVPADNPESNFGAAKQALRPLARAMKLLPVDTAKSPGDAARLYEKQLLETLSKIPGNMLHTQNGDIPRLDFALLGLGSDGHTASLFPETNACTELQSLVIDQYPAGKNPRVTMTVAMLNAARICAFMITGEGKQSVLRTIRADPLPDSPCLPAQHIKPQDGKIYLFADKKAAGALSASSS